MSYKIINVGVNHNGIYYNSYLIISKKIALIDTVPKECTDEFIKNILKHIEIKNLDIVIINHTESDRTGALKKILEIKPNVEIVASLAGLKNLEQQLNFEFNQILAKSNMTYNLGNGVTLRFIITHNINWPDSMMTYFIEEKILFSCDAFSFEKSDAKDYFLKNLYPMSDYVKESMHQLKDFKISKIYTGSGNAVLDDSIIDNYISWCDTYNKENCQIAVIYKSNSGNNKLLADYTLEKLSDYLIKMYDACNFDENSMNEIYNSKGVIFITPTEYRNIPKEISDIIIGINHYKVSDIMFAAIGSYGWSGEAPNLIHSILKARHFNVYKSPLRIMFSPSNEDFDELDKYLDSFIKSIN